MKSQSHKEAEALQESLIRKGRVYQLWASLAVIVIWVSVTVYFAVSEIIVVAGAITWLGILVHWNFTQVINELLEMNDQLAGRKDEFREILEKQR